MGKGKGEKGERRKKQKKIKKKATLASGPLRTKPKVHASKRRHATRKMDCLSDAKQCEFQLFPRAGAQFRPSGYRLDFLVLWDQAKRTNNQDHTTTLKIQKINPKIL